jgi:hypothetical protein
MNEATMTTTALHPVDDFARAVRAALADLPADEVEDLTDGLEADLAERAADEESPDFGDPVAYANELRSAAGLPARASHRPSSMGSVLGSAWADLLGGLRELHKHPLIARLAAFFVTLRPLWWAFRAAVFYGILTWAIGTPFLAFNLGTILLGAICLVLSVQLGRGKWQPKAWMRTALLAINVLLVITVPVALLAMTSAFSTEVNNAFADGQNQSQLNYDGLEFNGQQITNVFAYDASGRPLINVQLFDQRGKPLNAVPDSSVSVSDSLLVPNREVVGRKGWNVYPLESIKASQLGDNGEPKKGAKPKPVTPTYLIVAPLANAAPTPTPTPTATPTPAPTN